MNQNGIIFKTRKTLIAMVRTTVVTAVITIAKKVLRCPFTALFSTRN
jgi:hypothetical protein